MSELSDRLADARRSGEPAPEELERLVSMISDRELESSERLTSALEGLARWVDSTKPAREAPQPAPVREKPQPQPQPQREVETRLDAFARTLRKPQQPTVTRGAGAPPIASLRSALAEIAARQKALDEEDAAPPAWQPAGQQQENRRPAPVEPRPAAALWGEPLRDEQRPTVRREEDSSYRQRAPEPEPRRAPESQPAASREPAPRPVETRSVDASAMAGIRDEIDRLGRRVEALPTRAEIDGLAREMGGLAGRLSADRPARLDTESLKAIDALVGEVDRMRAEVASPRIIAGLSEELKAISSRLDVLGPRSANAIEALEHRLDEVRGELDQFPRSASVDRLAVEIQSLVDRLDQQEHGATPAFRALDEKIEAIAEATRARGVEFNRLSDAFRAELEGLPRASDVNDLGRQIGVIAEATRANGEEFDRLNAAVRSELEALPHASDVNDLGRQIDAIAEATRANGRDFDRLSEAFQTELESLPRAAEMNDFGRQIEALTESLRVRPAPAPAVTAFKDLSGKVDALDGKIEAIAVAAINRDAQVEQLARDVKADIAAIGQPAVLDALASQIEALTARLSTRHEEPVVAVVETLSTRVDTLNERMDDMAAATRARSASFDRVEDSIREIADRLTSRQAAPASEISNELDDQIGVLVRGIERNDGRLDDLHAAFAGLASRVEQSSAQAGAEAARAAIVAARDAISAPPSGDVGGVLAEALNELRSVATRTERRTADTLDAVRATLERLLDRMEDAPEPAPYALAQIEPRRPVREERPATAPAPAVDATEAARAAARRALAEITAEPETAFRVGRPQPERTVEAPAAFPNIADLAPDHPIEPGSGVQQQRPEFSESSTASQTAAALIAAARRAAVQTPAGEEPAPVAARRKPAASSAKAALSERISALKSRKKPIVLVAAATLIVVAALYVASGITGSQPELAPEPAQGVAPQAAPAEPAPVQTPAPAPEKKSELDQAPPASLAADVSQISPQPIAKQASQFVSPRAPAGDLTPFAFSQAQQPQSRESQWTVADPAVTGSLGKSVAGLPDAVGGPNLRTQAAAGDPGAQLEVADRLLDGRGVPANATAAAGWLEKAANQGLAPAQQRLGSLYEKGRGVTRDIQNARRWYEQAAASGNVRAMHNLGVIHAEGGLGKPDYSAAVVWFRMAAERGLVDSQYNLAVLCARGLGGKRDLFEAYKWFALASAQGDEDASRKRDEVGKALGASLTVAQAAVDSFKARPVEAAANEAPAPQGGWDQASARPAQGAAKIR